MYTKCNQPLNSGLYPINEIPSKSIEEEKKLSQNCRPLAPPDSCTRKLN